MTPGRDAADYLHDMVEYAEKAERFLGGAELEAFRSDEKAVLAVIRALEVIGEAAKNIPSEFRQQHPDIPWEDAAGMRDVLAHAYFGVDVEVVWRTVREDIPRLRTRLASLLTELGIGLDAQ
jgi:uncharacterized protein with HEPN domain